MPGARPEEEIRSSTPSPAVLSDAGVLLSLHNGQCNS